MWQRRQLWPFCCSICRNTCAALSCRLFHNFRLKGFHSSTKSVSPPSLSLSLPYSLPLSLPYSSISPCLVNPAFVSRFWSASFPHLSAVLCPRNGNEYPNHTREYTHKSSVLHSVLRGNDNGNGGGKSGPYHYSCRLGRNWNWRIVEGGSSSPSLSRASC